MTKLKFYLIFAFVTAVILVSQFLPQKAQAYDMNLIVSDGYFTDYNSMSATQINSFLISKGSVYANYMIPEYVTVPYPYAGGNWGEASVRQINSGTGETFYNKTVAQLIYDECQAHHVNPRVILAIIQKESSTIEQSNPSSTRMAWPLFYAFDESMASFGYDQGTAASVADNYGGVGQQIAYATWNFGDKYTKWGNGTYGNWRAGMNIDGTGLTPQSIATRLLYTYTPHSWQSFLNVLAGWGWAESGYLYSSAYVSQSSYPTLSPGGSTTTTVSIRNTGTATWTSDVVHLGTYRPQDRGSSFAGGSGWLGSSRVVMQESSVAPGGIANFIFTLTAPGGLAAGAYNEYFRPVADGITWMNDHGIYIPVTVN